MAAPSARPRVKGRVLWLVVGLCLGLMASCSAWLFSLKSPPIPPLLQTLPSPFARTDHNQVLTERLHTQFPVGTPEAVLIRELWLQGFSPLGDWQTLQRAVGFDTAGKGGFTVCRIYGRVTWSVDGTGRVAEISGSYNWVCL
jgi:hypothetical protein